MNSRQRVRAVQKIRFTFQKCVHLRVVVCCFTSHTFFFLLTYGRAAARCEELTFHINWSYIPTTYLPTYLIGTSLPAMNTEHYKLVRFNRIGLNVVLAFCCVLIYTKVYLSFSLQMLHAISVTRWPVCFSIFGPIANFCAKVG